MIQHVMTFKSYDNKIDYYNIGCDGSIRVYGSKYCTQLLYKHLKNSFNCKDKKLTLPKIVNGDLPTEKYPYIWTVKNGAIVSTFYTKRGDNYK